MWWSWVLTTIGITGYILIGRKVWWAWYVNIGVQVLWIIYAIQTKQYGFIVSAVMYAIVFATNARKWTNDRESKAASDLQISNIIGVRYWCDRSARFHVSVGIDLCPGCNNPLESEHHIATSEIKSL